MEPKKPDKKKNPERFYGELKDISVSTIIDYIRFSCIVHINAEGKKAALFFIKGKLVDVRQNKEINVKAIDEIKKWKKGSFSYCEWKDNIETKIKYLEDILYLVNLLKSNCKLTYNNENISGEIHIEKGKVTKAVFNDIDGEEALRNLLLSDKGNIITKANSQEKGNLNLSYSDTVKLINNRNKKTKTMDVNKLKNSIEVLKQDLGDALVAADIWPTGTGQSIAGFNSQPKATALFEQLTQYMNKSLTDSGFPGLDKYYMMDMEADSLIIVLQFEGYQWGMLVNSSKVQLGLLLNIAIPKAREAFLDASK